MAISTQRLQRTTAGQTSKYADYSLVSFPQLKKHSIIKTSLINVDPLSPGGTQVGNIKAYGEKKKLMIIKTGTHQEMEEVSSRFSKESGSEEIIIPERECEYSITRDIRQQRMDEDVDDDDYEPPTYQTKKPTKRTTSSGRKQTTTADCVPLLSTSGFDKDDEEDFGRILSSPLRSTSTKNVMHKKRQLYSSSTSTSVSSDDGHEDRWTKNKENLIKSNVNLDNLNNKKRKKKKRRTDPIVVPQPHVECQVTKADFELLKKRVSKLEKVYSVIKKNTSFDQGRSSTSNTQSDLTPDIFTEVKNLFGIDPSTLKSPINRPTKIMRELYKNSGRDLFQWKDFFETNESVLKDFIQQKCLILPEDLPHTWLTILNSMAQMPYDATKYKQKSSIPVVCTVEISNNSPATPASELSFADNE